MNRHDRRTDGKRILKRIQQLKSSKILNSLYLKDIAEDDLVLLKAGTHNNKYLQKLFNQGSRLANELMLLEGELFAMNKDLADKIKATPVPDSEEHQSDQSA